MLFTEFLPTPNNLKLRQIPMLALPGMSMQRKALALRLRNPRKHAHLNNNHRREDLSDRHDRTTTALVSLRTLHAGGRKIGWHLLSAVPAETSLDLLPASRLPVLVLLHHAFWIVDYNLLLFDGEVRRYV